MKRTAVTLVLAAFSFLVAFSCSKDSNSTGPTPARPARTIYVDSASIDSIDGSAAHPYTTVTAALNAAIANDTIQIAAGTYSFDEIFPLHLKPGNVLVGEDASSTSIPGPLLDENTGTANPIQISNLHFTKFAFNRDAAPGTASGTNKIESCLVDSTVTIAHGGGHHFTIHDCHIIGEVTFSHGAGPSVNRVLSNQIDGGMRFANGDGATDTISNNLFWGGTFVYQSGISSAQIGGNELHNAGFVDLSGSGSQIIAYNQFEFSGSVDPDSAAVVLKGNSVIFRQNVVHGFSGPALNATSGTPTIIDSNVIQSWNGSYCMRTRAGVGQIIGNQISGTPCGLHDESAATLIAGNTIVYSDTGLYCASAAELRRNEIAYCTGPGIVLDGSTGPVDSNYIHENANGIVIVSGSPDLGGGAAGSVGHNRFYTNPPYNLINYSASAIKAENNTWNNSNADFIGWFDIWDKADNAACGEVDFVPFLTPTSYSESGRTASDRQR